MESDVTMFTPGGRPRVSDEPVLLSVFLTIAHKDDGVVDVGVNLIATVEDTAVVGAPVACVNRYGNRANGSNCVDQLEVVIGSQFDVPTNLDL